MLTIFFGLCSNNLFLFLTYARDGATMCGILCASLYICDQIRAEGVVDVFHAVKCIRTNRPQFIVDLVN